MKLKENEIIPSAEIFLLENGEPKLYYLVYQELIPQYVQLNICQVM